MDQYKSMIKLPPGLWKIAKRPYFAEGMKHLKANLPWGTQHTIKETEDTHNVFEAAGFELGPVLGRGTFSTVVTAYWIQYRQNVAVKIYTKKKDHDTRLVFHLLPSEIEMLKRLKHPNIIAFFGAVETKLRVYLIMELAGEGNLLEYLVKHDYASEQLAKKWFSQLMSGIKYAHDLEIAHRDIKLENLLLDMQQNIRITDFGFATPNIAWSEEIPNSGWPKVNDIRGSASYMAPELILGDPYNPLLADVWALGVVLYCILFGRFPLGELTWGNMRELIEDFELPDEPLVSDDCEDTFRSIFKMEDERVRSVDLLECHWLDECKEEIELGRRAKMTVVAVDEEKEREQRIMDLMKLKEKLLKKNRDKKYYEESSSESSSESLSSLSSDSLGNATSQSATVANEDPSESVTQIGVNEAGPAGVYAGPSAVK